MRIILKKAPDPSFHVPTPDIGTMAEHPRAPRGSQGLYRGGEFVPKPTDDLPDLQARHSEETEAAAPGGFSYEATGRVGSPEEIADAFMASPDLPADSLLSFMAGFGIDRMTSEAAAKGETTRSLILWFTPPKKGVKKYGSVLFKKPLVARVNPSAKKAQLRVPQGTPCAWGALAEPSLWERVIFPSGIKAMRLSGDDNDDVYEIYGFVSLGEYYAERGDFLHGGLGGGEDGERDTATPSFADDPFLEGEGMSGVSGADSDGGFADGLSALGGAMAGR